MPHRITIKPSNHSFETQDGETVKADGARVPGKGKLTLSFVGEDGTKIEREVFQFPGPGVAMAMYNLDDSIRDFARASMNYAYNRG